ncbi:MAG: hypothetical protein ABI690_15775 [Chloroflexota bacterium]
MIDTGDLLPIVVDEVSPQKNPRNLRRLIIDVLFGVIAPIATLIFDPAIFRGGIESGLPVLAQWRVFAYIAIPIGVAVFTLWLSLRFRLKAWSGMVAGVLFAGAVFSLLIGIAILPITLFGLLLGIGILGFIPFITAVIFFRNALQAFNYVGKQLNLQGMVGSFLLGALMSVTIPAAAQLWTANYVQDAEVQIIAGDVTQAEVGLADLRRAFWCELYCYRDLEVAYPNETDPTRRQRLASAYLELTGREIEWRRYSSD